MLVGPYFVDWTAYRADFEREASRILGRTLSVEGEASARLLPFPSVTFTEVSVAGAPGEPPLLVIDGFSMDAELAPFVSGEIRIFSMRLDRPRLRVPVSREGAIELVGADSALPEGATVVLERVEIVDGSIAIENEGTGRRQDVTGIEATLSARSITGPIAGSGTLNAGGERLGFTLSSGAGSAESGLPLKLTVTSPSLDASLVVDGSATVADGRPAFSGSLRVTSPLPEPAAAAASTAPVGQAEGTEAMVAQPDAGSSRLLPPIDLSGKLLATPSGIEVTEARLEAGGGETPYILTGSGNLGLSRLPHFSLVLEGEQVDVDEIVGEDAIGGAPEGAPRPGVTFEERLEAARAVFSAVPRPSIPGTLSVTLPVVVAGDTTVRDVAFTVSPTDTGWSVERFRAELPGRTSMEATGVLGLGEAAPRAAGDAAGAEAAAGGELRGNDSEGLSFAGNLLVASRQPSGFSGWLTGEVDPAVRTLTQAGFSADVTLTKASQSFRDLEVDVGGDILTGRLDRAGPPGDRRLTAELSAGKVDLDALLALSRLFTGADDSIANAERIALKIGAGPVTYGGSVAGRIDADLSYDGTRLRIGALGIDDLAGADLTMSGELQRLGGDASGRLQVALEAARPAEVIGFLKERLPASPALEVLAERGPLLGPLSLKGEVRTLEEAPGEQPTLEAEISGSAAKTALALKLTLGNGIYARGESGRFGLDLTLSNETPLVLLGQIGLDPLPTAPPSPLALQVQLSAGPTGPVVASAAIRAPGTEITAEGSFDITASGVSAADFGLAARSADLGPWLVATGTELGLSPADALPVDLSGTLTFADSDLTLDALGGRVAGADVAGTLSRHAGGAVAGQLELSELSLPWLSALVTGRPPGGADSAWSEESFGISGLPPLDVSLDMDVARLSLGAGKAVTDVAARLSASGDGIAFEDVNGAIGGGYVSASGSLRNAGGVGAVALDATFTGLDLGTLALAARGDGGDGGEAGGSAAEAGLAGTLDATLSLSGSGQSYQGLVSGLSGAGRFDVADGSFSGLRRGLLAPILEGADAPGFMPDTGTAPLVAGLLSGARYDVPSASADISAVAGVIRTGPVAIAAGGETLAAEASLDLETMGVSGALRLELDPGDEAVEGAAPSIVQSLSGSVAAPVLSTDVQPLASFLSVRAYEREQARVEAIQEQLQERLRLRREVRYTRWREEQRKAAALADAAAAEIERLRLVREKEERARIAAEAERARVEAEAEAARAAEAARQAEVARQAEEARRAEAARIAEEAMRAAELERIEAERRAAEERQAEQRRAEEARWAEEVRRALDAGRSGAAQQPPSAGAPAAPGAIPGEASPNRTRPANTTPARPRPAIPPAESLENPVARTRSPSAPALPPSEFEQLPGVSNPLDF